MVTTSSGQLPQELEEFIHLLDTLHPSSGYTICGGIPKEIGLELKSFVSKNARVWGFPFDRVDHKACSLWFRPLSISPIPTCSAICFSCSKLLRYFRKEITRCKRVIPEQKDNRTHPSSHCPIAYLSPASTVKRIKRLQRERRAMKKQVDKAKIIVSCLSSYFSVLYSCNG